VVTNIHRCSKCSFCMQNSAFCSSKCLEIRSRGMGHHVAYRAQKKLRFCPVKKQRDISLWKISACSYVEKYMKFLAFPSRRSMKGSTINGVTYEGVTEYMYLGTLISNDNSVQKEIQRRILACNRTYFAAISLFRNRLLSRTTKIR
jgi:hypothetical protein